jgi:hypothetical protein
MNYSYVFVDETYSQLIGPVEPDSEGVYVITTVTRKERPWRSNNQSPTDLIPFRQATKAWLLPM